MRPRIRRPSHGRTCVQNQARVRNCPPILLVHREVELAELAAPVTPSARGRLRQDAVAVRAEMHAIIRPAARVEPVRVAGEVEHPRAGRGGDAPQVRRESRGAAVQRPQERGRRHEGGDEQHVAPRGPQARDAGKQPSARRAGAVTGRARSFPPIRIVTRSARSSSARGICRSSTSGTVRLRTARFANSSGACRDSPCDSSSASRSAQPRYSPGS